MDIYILNQCENKSFMKGILENPLNYVLNILFYL